MNRSSARFIFIVALILKSTLDFSVLEANAAGAAKRERSVWLLDGQTYFFEREHPNQEWLSPSCFSKEGCDVLRNLDLLSYKKRREWAHFKITQSNMETILCTRILKGILRKGVSEIYGEGLFCGFGSKNKVTQTSELTWVSIGGLIWRWRDAIEAGKR